MRVEANTHRIKIGSELEMYKLELSKLREIFMLKLPNLVSNKLTTLNDRVDEVHHNHMFDVNNMQE